MPFTHLLIKVPTAEFEAIVKFYTAALKPTGYKLIMDRPGFAGLGAASPDFFIKASDDAPTTNTHVAFPAPDRAAVDAFHAAALEAGGEDHGAPGVRTNISATYYAAFTLDKYGNNIEALYTGPA